MPVEEGTTATSHKGRWITEVHPHDVLNGRGVNIASHPGNLRFRALIKTHADEDYCTNYSAMAKKAIAQSIVEHIRNLDPPGRFLRRPARKKGKPQVEQGVWEELHPKEALKKATQALRDCNRIDRSGYADAIEPPADVKVSHMNRQNSGMSQKQYAEAVAKESQPPSVALGADPLAPSGQPQLWVDTAAAAFPQGLGSLHRAADATAAFTPKHHTITPTTVGSTGDPLDRYPIASTRASSGDGMEDPHESLDPMVPHPFADAFEDSPQEPVSLDYDEHFDTEEERKLTALARESAALDAHFDTDSANHDGEPHGRHLGETSDFSNIFDGDLAI